MYIPFSGSRLWDILGLSQTTATDKQLLPHLSYTIIWSSKWTGLVYQNYIHRTRYPTVCPAFNNIY